jgi:hypothetical protein
MISMMQGVLGLASGTLVGLVDLVGFGGVVCRRRIARHPVGAAGIGAARRAQCRVCGSHYCGGALYAGA